jgi:NADPH:quinone reductase-like Zn-dependent oxidoreductase
MQEVQCVAQDTDLSRTVAVVEVNEPSCPEAGVVVAVRARPINPADLLLLTGRHVYTPQLPSPVGIEGAGVVVEAGPASRLSVGDHVAIPAGGTWRERMALADADVLPVDRRLDLEQASMLSVNPFTAAGLLEGLASNACVVVNAPTSAIARLILSMCRSRGISAIAVGRDAGAEASALSHGAHAFVVDGPDLGARVRRVAPGPVVRALDAVAGDASARLFDAVSDGGELVVYGLLSDDTVRLPAAGVVFRDVTVRGYSRLRCLRALSSERRAELTAELVGLVERGALSTPVEARYSLEDVTAALAHHARPGRTGKILLVSA